MEQVIELFTDAATLCVFDPACLQHRLQDRPDWWTTRTAELAEMNSANIVIINIGTDGMYKLRVHDGPVRSKGLQVTAVVRCASGQLFIGPGEQIPGASWGPDPQTGGGDFRNMPAELLAELDEAALDARWT